MALDSTHRRRTWKQSKQFKQEARKDRGHFSKNNSGSTPQQGPLGGPPGVKPSGSKPFRRRLNREQLKKVTKCRLCSKKGHWAEDCPLNKNKPVSVQAFVFLSGDDHERGQGDQLASFLSFAEVNGVLEQVLGPLWNRHGSQVGPSVYLTLTSGQAIIDPGAAQDLIGKPAYDRLKEHLASCGLQPVVQENSGSLRNPSGIGGSAKALFKSLVPVSFGQKPGLLEMTVIDADIPPLVSVGFLDFLGTSLNLPKNKIVFEKLGITMPISKLPSGHRTIELCDWPGGAFPVPSNVKDDFGLKDGAFNLFADVGVPPPCVMKKVLLTDGDINMNMDKSQDDLDPRLQLQKHIGTSSVSESVEVDAVIDSVTVSMQVSPAHISYQKSQLGDRSQKDVNPDVIVKSSSQLVNLDASNCSQSLSGETFSQFDRSASSSGHGSFELCSSMGQMASAAGPRVHADGGISHGICEAAGVREDQEEPQVRSQLQGAMDGGTGILPASSKQGREAGQQVCDVDSLSTMRCPAVLHQSQHQGDQDGAKQFKCKERECRSHDAREQGIEGSRSGGGNLQQCCAHGQVSRSCETRKLQATRVCGRSDELPGANSDWTGLPERSTLTSYESTGDRNEPVEPGSVCDAGLSQQPREPEQSGSNNSGPNVPDPNDRTNPTSHCFGGERGRHGSDNLWRPVGGPQSKLGRLTSRALMATWFIGPMMHSGSVISWEHLSPQGQAAWKEIGMDESYLVVPRRRSGTRQCNIVNDLVLDETYALEEPFVLSEEQAFQKLYADVESFVHDENLVQQNFFDGLDADQAWEQMGFHYARSTMQSHCPRDLQADCVHRVWRGVNKPTSEHLNSRHFADIMWTVVADETGVVVFSGRQLDSSWLQLDDSDLPVHQVHVWIKEGACPPRGFHTPLRKAGKWFLLNQDGQPDPHGHFLAYPRACSEPQEPLEFSASSGRIRRNLNCLVGKRPTWKIAFAELFSPDRVSPHVRGLKLPMVDNTSFDKTEDWNVFVGSDRQRFWTFLHKHEPLHLAMSPECRAHSPIMNINWDRMDPEKAEVIKVEGKIMWDFSISAAWEQLRCDRFFSIEHPAGASSWQDSNTRELMDHPDVAFITFDQCACGLQVHPSGLSEKSTSFLTNNPWLALELSNKQCNGQHCHVRLEGGQLTKKAQVYPPALCQTIAHSVEKLCGGLPAPSFLEATMDFPVVEEEEADMFPQPLHEPAVSEEPKSNVKVSEKQKRLVRRVHVNTGHPSRDQFLRMLKAAGTRKEVLKYVRDQFTCDHCDLQRGPAPRRRAQMPKTFAFNKIVALDVLYISFQDLRVPILNAVCVGSNLQVAVRLPIPKGLSGGTPTSYACWKGFVETWCRYLVGVPEMVMSDPGNEFRGYFERGCEFYGIYQHLCHPESPWENGKAERHGGWLKDRLDAEIRSGRGVLENLSDIDEYLAEVCACKNRWYCREGYTPYQLVFGEQPRLPHDLLSDHITSQHCLRDVYEDPLEVDSAAGEFRRRFVVRQAARQQAMKQASHQAISRATKSAVHLVKNWAPGQWVYVFRRARAGNDLHPRDRWVGPGVVILSNNATVYVGMRSRLWRCSHSQLRPALPAEILGKEIASDPGLQDLLHQVMSSSRVGAVAVDKEGPPGPEHDLLPVHQGEGAGELPEAPSPHMDIEVGGGSMSAPPADLSPPPGLDIPVPAGVRRTREAENVNLPSPMRRRVSDISVEEPLLEPPPSGQPSSSRLQPVLEEGDENERATPYPAEEDHASTSMPPVPDTPVPPQPHITQSISSSEHQEPETPPLPATTTTTTQPPYPPPHPGEPEPWRTCATSCVPGPSGQATGKIRERQNIIQITKEKPELSNSCWDAALHGKWSSSSSNLRDWATY